MNELSHGKQVLVMTLGELAFAVVALPLYWFLVLPKHADGVLPGFVPVVADGVNPVFASLLAIGILAIAMGVVFLAARAFGIERFVTDDFRELVTGFSLVDFAIIYLAAGFGEEFLFRVVLTDVCGLIISSVLFAAIHIAYWRKPLLMLDVFLVAMLFGAFYLCTESLLLCAMVHALYNFLISYLLKSGKIPLESRT